MRSSPAEKSPMTIGSFARRAGVSADTARFYERIGLLKPVRQENNYRLYGADELARIEFITRARASGFTLSEVRAFLAMVARGKKSCIDYSAVVQKKLRDLDEQIRSLQTARRELRNALRSCGGGDQECPHAPAN
ncbi:MAG: heavy metal-responsive transcriptional regulator [Leptospirales bacterium]|nr:heavy metal-responsive transcriptional regulator [Leptospirales bacterium]